MVNCGDRCSAYGPFIYQLSSGPMTRNMLQMTRMHMGWNVPTSFECGRVVTCPLNPGSSVAINPVRVRCSVIIPRTASANDVKYPSLPGPMRLKARNNVQYRNKGG